MIYLIILSKYKVTTAYNYEFHEKKSSVHWFLNRWGLQDWSILDPFLVRGPKKRPLCVLVWCLIGNCTQPKLVGDRPSLLWHQPVLFNQQIIWLWASPNINYWTTWYPRKQQVFFFFFFEEWRKQQVKHLNMSHSLVPGRPNIYFSPVWTRI